MSRFYKTFSLLILFYIGMIPAIKNENENNESVKEFRYCLRKSEHPNIKECAGRAAISFLQRFDERDNFTLAGNLVVSRDDAVAARSLVNFLDTDPVDFRGIFENAGAVFSQRSLEFHMDTIYPGLMFKIGPSADSNSVAEFMLDPTVNERNLKYEEPSTARILTRHYLLPFLLGLKFNLVALVPILFTVICLLLKKSLFIAKLVIYISSILGVGGIAGALGRFGALGGLFSGHSLNGDGTGGFSEPQHGPAFGVPHIGGAVGLYPGKNTVYSQYDQDELQHVSPYKRHDRKVVFEKTRENTGRIKIKNKNNIRSAVDTEMVTPSADRFYEYEKQAFIHEQSSKGRTLSAGLEANNYKDDQRGDVLGNLNAPTSQRFQTSDNNGWKVLNVRRA